MQINEVRKLTIEVDTKGVEQTTDQVGKLTRGEGDLSAAVAKRMAQMERSQRLYDDAARQAQTYGRALGTVTAANDNLSRSYQAANDNVAAAGKTWSETAVQTAELANHLKLAAVAAYVAVPAFRAVANPAIAAALGLSGRALAAMSPAAASLGTVVIGRLLPALTFLGRIALPITAAVEAWRLLNYVIDLGAGLLDKYANAQRNLVSGVDDSLKKLTKFQDSDLTAQQVQYATELGARLAAAKKTISDFAKVQFDLTDPALKLQAAWVRIVELIAVGVDRLNDFLNLLAKLPGGSSGLLTVASNLPAIGPAVMAARGVYALAGPAPAEPSASDALAAARARLAAGLGSQSNFANRFGQAVNDLANPKDLDKAKEDVKKVTTEFDRLEASMQRSAALQEAEAKAVDASVGEHARLRAELRLQEAALQDIAKNGGKLDDYAARIKVLADRFAKAAQEAAELKLKSDIKFNLDTAFLSDSEKQIASILRQVYGSEWKNMMNGPIAGAIRFNNMLFEVRDTLRDIGGTVLKSVVGALTEGKNVGEALSGALKSLSARLADKAIENLLSGDFAKAAISGISAAATFIGSKLLGTSDADKELEKAKKAWFDMTGELKQFEATAAGFDLSGPASQIDNLRQIYDKLNVAAFAAGDFAGMQKALTAFGGNLTQVVKAFEDGQSPLSDFARQIVTLTDQANQLAQTLFQNGSALGNEVLARLPAQIDALRQKASQSLTAGINSAQGRGFINDINDLFASVAQFRSEQSITGIPTGLINDYFIAQAQKIIDDSNLVGQSFSDLLTIFPDLTGKVHESTSALQDQADAQSRLAQQLTQAARGVVDYVNSLNVGPDSALSPQARLAAAQSTYNATLGLAQAGNVDALGRVTADFENLRKAAQSFFGSSGGYQNILNTGVAQLLALPAVQTSTDPIVQALLNVQQAVQATTVAAQGTTGAVNSGTAATTPRLDQVVSRLVDAVNNLASVLNTLTSSNNILTGSQNILSAIQGLQSTAAQQLALLNSNLTITGQQVHSDSNAVYVTSNNNLLTALNKVVINTGATAYNTFIQNEAAAKARLLGTFATGGVLGAGQFGIMGEHHPDGPFILRAGSSPVPITPALPSFANDNGALRAIRAELAALRMEMALNTAVADQGNRINSAGHAGNIDAVNQQTRAIKDEAVRDRLKAEAA